MKDGTGIHAGRMNKSVVYEAFGYRQYHDWFLSRGSSRLGKLAGSEDGVWSLGCALSEWEIWRLNGGST